MSRKAKLEGTIYDVAKRPHTTDSRSATAQQAYRRRSIAAPHRAGSWPATRCGKRLPAPESASIPAASAAPRKWRRPQAGPFARSRGKQSRHRRQTHQQKQQVGRQDGPLCRPRSRRNRLHRRRGGVLAGRVSQHHHRRRRHLALQRFFGGHQGQLGMEALQAHRVGRRL